MKFVRLSRRALVCAATLAASGVLFLAPAAHASNLEQQDCEPGNEYCYTIFYGNPYPWDSLRVLAVSVGVHGQSVYAAAADGGDATNEGAYAGSAGVYAGYDREANYWVIGGCVVACPALSQWAGYSDSGTAVLVGSAGFTETADDYSGTYCQLSPIGDVPCPPVYSPLPWVEPPYLPLFALLPELP